MSVPTVYCIIPVHNRLNITSKIIDYLNAQDFKALHIIIVDDGSTDGTYEYLKQVKQANLTVLRGDGNLWWGGSMRMGMDFIAPLAHKDDYLLMLNDDVCIKNNYISVLVERSAKYNDAIVGSAQCDMNSKKCVSCGVYVDFMKMIFRSLPCSCTNNVNTIKVNALPGRGTLFPYKLVANTNGIYSKLFPHYLGDLEYTSRLYEAGAILTVSADAKIFMSMESSDKLIQESSLCSKWLHMRSKSNILHRMIFFSIRGPFVYRISAIPRYFILRIGHFLKQLLS